MIAMINGFACATPAEVRLARHGLDPENPTRDPAVAETLAERPGRAVMPAAVFDGLLAPAERPKASDKPEAPAWRLFDITA